MYLLDTNVVSELRKARRADLNVLLWIAGILPSMTFISVVTVLELERGALLVGRRDVAQGRMLLDWIDRTVLPSFADRILPIDTTVARRCAALHVPDPRPERDALIAATALAHSLTVATRNVRDFASMNVSLIDPWSAS